jgi:hypothetical protein
VAQFRHGVRVRAVVQLSGGTSFTATGPVTQLYEDVPLSLARLADRPGTGPATTATIDPVRCTSGPAAPMPAGLVLSGHTFPQRVHDVERIREGAEQAVRNAGRAPTDVGAPPARTGLVGPGSAGAAAVHATLSDHVLRGHLPTLSEGAGSLETTLRDPRPLRPAVRLRTELSLQARGARLVRVGDGRKLGNPDRGAGPDASRPETTSTDRTANARTDATQGAVQATRQQVEPAPPGGLAGYVAPGPTVPLAADSRTDGVQTTHDTSAGIELTEREGRALLIRVPATWRHTATELGHRPRTADRGSAVVDVHSTVDVWVSEAEARALGVVTDETFPPAVSTAWDQVKKVTDQWTEAARRRQDVAGLLDSLAA